MTDSFTIKVGEFEGPLEALLNLIEKRKLHISDVSLSKVADDYVNYMQKLNLPMAELASFIMVASTLMLIKSLSLLPGIALTEEEKESIEDLENRLKHYQRIRDLSEHVKERFGNNLIFSREPYKEVKIVFAPTAELSTDNLWQSIKNVLKSLPQPEKIPQAIVKKVISLEEVIDNLAQRVQRALKLRFSEFVGTKKERVDIVISFLGMLELVKQGVIEAKQESHFSDIDLESKNLDTPRY